MIQNIDSFPLEPVLMLKYATDFGFFQCCHLHRNSQLALTVCRMMVTTKILSNFHDIQKLLKRILLLLEVPSATFTLKNLCNKWTLEYILST